MFQEHHSENENEEELLSQPQKSETIQTLESEDIEVESEEKRFHNRILGVITSVPKFIRRKYQDVRGYFKKDTEEEIKDTEEVTDDYDLTDDSFNEYFKDYIVPDDRDEDLEDVLADEIPPLPTFSNAELVKSIKLHALVRNDEFKKFCSFEELGEGGMGKVWLIRKKAGVVDSDQRKFLQKYSILHGLWRKNSIVIKEGYKMGKEGVGAILYEGLTLEMTLNKTSNKNHRGIVRPYYLDKENGLLAMEYLEGKSLKDSIQEKGATESTKTYEFLIKLIEAIRFSHRKGVIHRDIKPANIQVEYDGNPCLIDFGIAFKPEEFDRSEEGIVGSMFYMAPEQTQSGKLEINDRTDVYGLGGVMYEMLTGEQYISHEKYKKCFRTKGGFNTQRYLFFLGHQKEYDTYLTYVKKDFKKRFPHIPKDVRDFCFSMLSYKNSSRPSLKRAQQVMMEKLMDTYLPKKPNKLFAKIINGIKSLRSAKEADEKVDVPDAVREFKDWPAFPDATALLMELSLTGNPKYLMMKRAVLKVFEPKEDKDVQFFVKIIRVIHNKYFDNLPPKNELEEFLNNKIQLNLIKTYTDAGEEKVQSIPTIISSISKKKSNIKEEDIKQVPGLSEKMTFWLKNRCPANVREDILKNIEHLHIDGKDVDNPQEILRELYDLDNDNFPFAEEIRVVNQNLRARNKILNVQKFQNKIQRFIQQEDYFALSQILSNLHSLYSQVA